MGRKGIAHICIDLQKHFYSFRPSDVYREKIAANVVNKLAPTFNVFSIPTFWVYHDALGMDMNILDSIGEGFHPDAIIAENDFIIRKNEVSAFSGSNIDSCLKELEVHTIFISGFYSDQCVAQTALDAKLRGYGITILSDGTDIGSYNNWSLVEPRLIQSNISIKPSLDIWEALI